MSAPANKNIEWIFIVNPAAGGGQLAKQWPNINNLLQKAGVKFQAIFSERKMHIATLTKKAIEKGIRHIVAVGGDEHVAVPREAGGVATAPVHAAAPLGGGSGAT